MAGFNLIPNPKVATIVPEASQCAGRLGLNVELLELRVYKFWAQKHPF